MPTLVDRMPSGGSMPIKFSCECLGAEFICRQRKQSLSKPSKFLEFVGACMLVRWMWNLRPAARWEHRRRSRAVIMLNRFWWHSGY